MNCSFDGGSLGAIFGIDSGNSREGKKYNYRGEKGGPFAHSQESHILSPTVDKPPQQPSGLRL